MYRRDLLGIAAGTVVGTLGAGEASAAHGDRAGSAGQAATGNQRGTTADGAEFAPLASLAIEGAREAVVGPDGATVFLAVEDGFAVADVSDPAEPRLVVERRGLLPDAEGGPMTGIQDVAVDGEWLLVMGPAHPGVAGPRGAILYDVGDPADPERLAVHRTDHPVHNGAFEGGLAYLAANDAEGNALEMVAMEAGGRGGGGAGTRVLGRWTVGDADAAWDGTPRAIRPLHDVTVHRGLAYCSFWDAGTWLVDVGDPAEPRAIGHFIERAAEELTPPLDRRLEGTELPGNHHSTSVDDSGTLLAVGHEAWDADGDGEGAPGGVDLVDVSTPDSPTVRSTIEPPPTDDPSREGVWTTAHNFELRGGYLYSAWYQGGVRVHDVSEPESPREVAAWRDAPAARFWTAQVAGGAAGGAIVASSASTGDDDAVEDRLYTFPLPGPVTTSSRRQVTATPGMGGFGAAAGLAGAGIASLLARRRRPG